MLFAIKERLIALGTPMERSHNLYMRNETLSVVELQFHIYRSHMLSSKISNSSSSSFIYFIATMLTTSDNYKYHFLVKYFTKRFTLFFAVFIH